MVIRATAQDYEAAFAMGVNVNRIYMAAFAIGSMLGGVAGVLVGVYYNMFYPTMGGLYGLKAFSASVVGGLTSLPGAVVAGLLIGIVETFSVEFGASNFRHIFSFVFMILILLMRPGGLLGRQRDGPGKGRLIMPKDVLGGIPCGQRPRRMALSCAFSLALLALPFAAVSAPTPYHVQVLVFIGIYVILALSLNLLNGYVGLLSIGHAAFYAVGAYASAKLTLDLHLPWIAALAGSGAIAGVFGYLSRQTHAAGSRAST